MGDGQPHKLRHLAAHGVVHALNLRHTGVDQAETALMLRLIVAADKIELCSGPCQKLAVVSHVYPFLSYFVDDVF